MDTMLILSFILSCTYIVVGVLLIVVLIQTIRILARTEDLLIDIADVWAAVTSFRSIPGLLLGFVEKLISSKRR